MIVVAGIIFGIFYLTVGYIGNKVVDKGTNAARKKKQAAEEPTESESLADRFEKGRKP